VKIGKLFQKNLFFSCVFLFFLLYGFSVSYAYGPEMNSDFNGSAWYTLEQARNAFERKDFGTAFRLVETAKDQRKKESEWASAALENALSAPAMLKAGTDIETVLNLLRERNSSDAVRVIEGVLERSKVEDFGYSIHHLNDFIKANTAYPEADFLLGKLYMLEGEYELSENFYSAAYKNRHALYVPDMQFDVLCDMAELYALTGDNEKYESVLLILASHDDLYGTGGEASGFVKAMHAAVKRGMDVDKFFMLYRSDKYHRVYVWLRLTKYYYSLDVQDKAFESALLFCITAMSRADNIIKSRETDYSYENVRALLAKIKAYPDINRWATENKLWEGFYLLGNIAKKQGNTAFARDIFTSLSVQSPDRKWKILAEKELAVL